MIVAFDPVLEPLLREIGHAAAEVHARAWVVGGVVRDALLGHPNKDVDVTVVGDVPRLVEHLRDRWAAEVEQHGAFTTATLRRPDGYHVDIVRARSEVYHRPGALPTITPAGLEEDLERRDFSINAMAASIRPADFGTLVDPLDGRSDLRNGVLRTLHRASFLDDPTRLFRAARYAVRYHLSPDPMTDDSAREAVRDGALVTISADRRRREVEIICAERRWDEMLMWLNRWGIWRVLAPGFEAHVSVLPRADVAHAWALRCLEEIVPERPEFRFLALLAVAPEGLAMALSARPVEMRYVERARRIVRSLSQPEGPDWYRAMDAESATAVTLALTLTRTDPQKRRLTEYLCAVRPLRPDITGADLQAAGIPPGPGLGVALRATLDAVRHGAVRGRKAELEHALRVYKEWEDQHAGPQGRPPDESGGWVRETG